MLLHKLRSSLNFALIPARLGLIKILRPVVLTEQALRFQFNRYLSKILFNTRVIMNEYHYIGFATKFVPFFPVTSLFTFPHIFLFIISYVARMIYASALYGSFKVKLYINCFCLLIINTVM